MPLGASGTDFGGPGAPIWEDLASILSKRFHSIPFHAHHATAFHSMSFHSIPSHPIPFHYIPCPFHSISVPLRAVPFYSIRFHSVGISLHAIPEFPASEFQSRMLPRYRRAGFPTSSLQSASAGCAKRKQFRVRRHNTKFLPGIPCLCNYARKGGYSITSPKQPKGTISFSPTLTCKDTHYVNLGLI